MDAVDLVICKALLRDPRISYRDLSKDMAMSSVAVHKRVQDLMRIGVINGFRGEIDIRALRGVSLMVYGRTEQSSTSQLYKDLSSDECTSMVLYGGGGYVFVGGMFRSISDLERYLHFVRTAGKMPDASAGLHTIRPSGVRMSEIAEPGAITPMEMRIIASLRHDARRPATEIAEELGLTARTVSAKIESMLKEHKLNLSMRWRPDYSSDTVAIFHMTLRPEADKALTISELYRRYPGNMVFLSSFSNLPEVVLATVWSSSPKDVARLADQMLSELGLGTVTPHVIVDSAFFETWKERLLDGVGTKKSKRE
ncbi:MAG: AsnC family transcriptional regulator [Methanomassiliicoccales archaeon]